MEEWWRKRSGTELYDIFQKINAENPLAARAFWSSVVGRGHGENDLQATTIHKMFNGDLDAYNNWRNAAHHGGYEAYQGNFDLGTGKWTAGPGYNQQYMADRGINAAGDWASSWNWGDYQKNLGLGLQSLPGHAYDGTAAWEEYNKQVGFGGGAPASPVVAGLQRPGVIPGTKPNPIGGAPMPAPTISVPGPTVGPGSAPSTPVLPNVATPTNPAGSPSVYQYRNRAGQVR
jgi:hypothetical protein